jgi:hypothetical protein
MRRNDRIRQRGGSAFNHLYNLQRWKRTRAEQLAKQPLCEFCLKRGRTVPANVCDHVNGHPVGETEAMFWEGPFQSLCNDCHNGDKARMEHGRAPRGCDDDGWPLAAT